MYDPSKPYKHEIQKLVSTTWQTPYVSVQPDIYPVITKRFSAAEVDHTDGIGTKGYYHWHQRTFKQAVIDALAMNLNDLALMHAVPYKLQNHITLPKDNHGAILEIVRHLVAQAKKRHIALSGGETSIHSNSDSLDISISMSGIVKKVKNNKLQAGDVLIGLPSNGLHSNGFSLVRNIFKNEQRPEFTKQTAIYIDQVQALGTQVQINGMMHITGGSFTKLKDLLDGSDAVIDNPLKPQLIFKELYGRGIKDEQMYKTFNCGTGFVIAIAPSNLKSALKNIKGRVIGRVINGSGKVVIASSFSDREVVY